jgi:hypothetical protein
MLLDGMLSRTSYDREGSRWMGLELCLPIQSALRMRIGEHSDLRHAAVHDEVSLSMTELVVFELMLLGQRG